MQAKFTSLNTILNNDTIVGYSTRIRLLKLQFNRWLPKNPLVCWHTSATTNKDHIADLLSNLSKFHLGFELNPLLINEIKGGTIPLINILDRFSYKNALKSLKYNNIMYLDQITSLD